MEWIFASAERAVIRVYNEMGNVMGLSLRVVRSLSVGPQQVFELVPPIARSCRALLMRVNLPLLYNQICAGIRNDG